jgi:hypothetical protein
MARPPDTTLSRWYAGSEVTSGHSEGSHAESLGCLDRPTSLVRARSRSPGPSRSTRARPSQWRVRATRGGESTDPSRTSAASQGTDSLVVAAEQAEQHPPVAVEGSEQNSPMPGTASSPA